MATAPLKLTEKEVRFARAFLHALHANETNGYLLLAVIAWMRAHGATDWTGNNPLGLRNSAGTLLRYSTYYAAAKATVYRLLHGSSTTGFSIIVLAARRAASSQTLQATQARDFLNAVALSVWDAKHYGLLVYVRHIDEYVLSHDFSKNSLIAIWAGLTGQKIPAAWFVDATIQPKAPPPAKPPFRQGHAGLNVVPTHEYIQPYAAHEFYVQRQHLDATTIIG